MFKFSRFVDLVSRFVSDNDLQVDRSAHDRIMQDLEYIKIKNRIISAQTQAEHRAKYHNA